MNKDKISQLANELESALGQLRRTKFSDPSETGLRRSERHTLRLIAMLNNERPVSASDLAKKLDVTMAAITHQTNSLEEQKYITRSASAEDGRVTLISLTETGLETLKQIKKSDRQKVDRLIEYLGDADSQQLINLVAKISAYVSKSQRDVSNQTKI